MISRGLFRSAGFRFGVVYAALLAAAFLLAVGVSLLFGAPVDNYVYDWMLRHYFPAHYKPEAIILAIEYRLSIGQRVATVVKCVEVPEYVVLAVRDAHRELFDFDAEMRAAETIHEKVQLMARLRGG